MFSFSYKLIDKPSLGLDKAFFLLGKILTLRGKRL